MCNHLTSFAVLMRPDHFQVNGVEGQRIDEGHGISGNRNASYRCFRGIVFLGNEFTALDRFCESFSQKRNVDLYQVDGGHGTALEIMTYVGISLSITGNLLSLLTQWKWA